MTLGEIIKKYRKDNGLSMDAFSEKSGISKAYISLLEKNKHPKTGKSITPSIQCIKQAADAMNIDFNLLFSKIDSDVTLTAENKTHKIKGVRIPILGFVRAGIPIDAIEEIIGWEEITPELASTGDFFCLEIKGDSMTPQIADVDIVVVRQQPDVESGEVGIVIVNGDEATCKKIIKYDESRSIGLVSFNTSYDPMYFSETDIIEKPVAIIGKVVELRRKF